MKRTVRNGQVEESNARPKRKVIEMKKENKKEGSNNKSGKN